MFYFVDYDRALAQMNRLSVFNTQHKRNMPDPLPSALVQTYKHSEIRGMQIKELTPMVGTGKEESHVPLFNILINETVYLQNGTLEVYRIIRKSLRDFRTRLRNNQDRHGRKEHVNR